LVWWLSVQKGDVVMSITATELKVNLGKYLMLAETEDIYITRNGKVVAKLTNPYQDRVDIAKSLFGILPNDMTLEEAKEERLNGI
jgi:prevent-host-death family protein